MALKTSALTIGAGAILIIVFVVGISRIGSVDDASVGSGAQPAAAAVRDEPHSSPGVTAKAERRRFDSRSSDESMPDSMQDRTLAESYEERSQRARNGDATAAYELFEDLQFCKLAEVRLMALEANAAAAQEGAAEAMVGYVIQTAERDSIFCKGVTDDMFASSFDWLAMAARAGNIDAKAQFFVHALSKYESPAELVANAEAVALLRNESMQHLKDSARAGHLSSVGNLADQYEQGTLVRRDLGLAYMYARVLEMSGLRSGFVLADRLRPLIESEVVARMDDESARFFEDCCK